MVQNLISTQKREEIQLKPSKKSLQAYVQRVTSANGKLMDVLNQFVGEFGSQHKRLLAAMILEYLSTRSWLAMDLMIMEAHASLNALLRLNVQGEVCDPLIEFSKNVRKNPLSLDTEGNLVLAVADLIMRTGNVISKCSAR